MVAIPHRRWILMQPQPRGLSGSQEGRQDARDRRDYSRILPLIEDEIPVSEWEVDGLRVWPLVRVKLGHSLFKRYLEDTTPRLITHPRRRSNQYRTVLAASRSFSIDRTVGDIRRLDPEVILVSDGVSLVSCSTGTTDRCLEPIRSELTRRDTCTALVVPSSASANRIGGCVSLPAIPNPRVVGGSLVRRPRTQSLLGYADVKRLLASCGLEDLLPSARRIEMFGLLLRRWARYLEPIFSGTRIAFFTEYYSSRAMASILACRAVGIPTVDVQHGVAGEFHFAYGRWRCVPVGGYSLLPEWFWCWSDEDAAAIDDWAASSPHRTTVGGVPMLPRDWCRSRGLSDERSSSLGVLRRIRVLYTLNPDEAPGCSPALQLVSSSPREWTWILRCHPCSSNRAEWNRAARLLDRDGLSVSDTTEPVQFDLAEVDVHVTQYSSVVLEATALGVPTIAVDPLASLLFSAQVQRGDCVVLDPYQTDVFVREVDRLSNTRIVRQPTNRVSLALDRVLEST